MGESDQEDRGSGEELDVSTSSTSPNTELMRAIKSEKYIREIQARREITKASTLESCDANKKKIMLDNLLNHSRELQSINFKLYKLLAQEELQPQMDADDALNEELINARSNLSGEISTTETNSRMDSRPEGSECPRGERQRLPFIPLATFSGDPLDWIPFWESFNSVHSDQGLSGALKFSYLLGQLRGEAYSLLGGSKHTAKNYEEAIRLLQTTYGDERVGVMHHLDAFFKLKLSDTKAADLMKFRADVRRHINALSALDFPVKSVEAANQMASLFLRSTLPVSLRDELLLEDDIVDLEELLTRLDRRISKARNYDEANKPKKQHHKQMSSRPRHRPENLESRKVSAFNIRQKRMCSFCNGNHDTARCLKYKSTEERRERVRALGICFKCLQNGHRASDCTQETECSICATKGHCAAFCFQGNFEPNRKVTKENPSQKTAVNFIAGSKNKSVSLMTGEIMLSGQKGSMKVRALFDQGAQRSFIVKSIAKQIAPPVLKQNFTVDGFLAAGQNREYEIADCQVQLPEEIIKLQLVMVDNLPMHVSTPGLSKIAQELKKKGVKLADSYSTDEQKIDVIVGNDNYHLFVPTRKVAEVNLVDSKIGTFISGPISAEGDANLTALKISVKSDEVEQLWALDTIGIQEKEAHPDDEAAILEFNRSIRHQDGRYISRLPWKAEHPTLSDNIGLAKCRLQSNLKRLQNDPDTLGKYDEQIKKQLKEGFIEEVPIGPAEGEKVHYLSHHHVLKDSPTTPLRIVYDCSAKGKHGTASLNDCLYSGPSLVQEMVQILLRFRLDEFAAASDISKAFLMIGLDPKDRDVTRFFWYQDPFTQTGLRTYRFRVILFGATCSQFILNASIAHHLKNNASKNQHLANQILKNLYVDNLLLTSQSASSLMTSYQESKELLNSAGLKLRTWSSNVEALNKAAQLNEEAEEREVVPILGLQWQRAEDSLSIAQKTLPDSEPTKRSVLSGLASQFDPLGWVAPITIRAKMLMKKIWQAKLDWDDKIDPELAQDWMEIKAEFHDMHVLKVERGVLHSNDEVTLHTFVDASTTAYGAVVYGVSKGISNLLMAKGRIAPNKKLSVPKLELTAALIGARLTDYILQAYQDELNVKEVHLWSDSQISLGWIGSNATLDAYQENRKAEIHRLLPDGKWHYVPTKENPADLITRGTTVSKLTKSDLWWHGPPWLTTTIEHETISVNVTPVQTKGTQFPPDSVSEKTPLEELVTRCSNLGKILRVVSLCQDWFRKKKENSQRGEEDSVAKIKVAERTLIIQTQNQAYPEEVNCLKREGRYTPLVKKLSLSLRDEVIVVVTRLQNATIGEEAKNPVLLPGKHIFTRRVIEDAHQRNGHAGVNSIVAFLRQRWWIPRVKARVKEVLRDCSKCKRFGQAYPTPQAPPLPKVRVSDARAFTVTGVDYGGPVTVRQGKEMSKRYIALFTCASTRAVHLEVAHDLSADGFLKVFSRFTARRACPRIMISDNASNFTMASAILKGWQENEDVRNALSQRSCEWRFIPSRAPWMGGFWERMIGMTKRMLAKAVGRSLLNDDELNTLLCKIEQFLNDRPITPVSDSITDLPALTPSQLIIGHRLDCPPEPVTDAEEVDDPTFGEAQLTRRQKHLQVVLNGLRKRWQLEYLTALRLSDKKHQPSIVPSVGDIVQVHDEGPRVLWRLGKITEIHQGHDGHIRSVKLQTTTGIISRPIAKLFPLETSIAEHHDRSTSQSGAEDLVGDSPELVPTTRTRNEDEQGPLELDQPGSETTTEQVSETDPGPSESEQVKIGVQEASSDAKQMPQKDVESRSRPTRASAQRARKWLRTVTKDL